MKPTKNEVRAAKKLQMAACVGFAEILDVSFWRIADPAEYWGKGGAPFMLRVNGKEAALIVDHRFAEDNGWTASKRNTLFFIKGLSKMSYDMALSEAHAAILGRAEVKP